MAAVSTKGWPGFFLHFHYDILKVLQWIIKNITDQIMVGAWPRPLAVNFLLKSLTRLVRNVCVTGMKNVTVCSTP